MEITVVETGEKKSVVIGPVEDEDFKILTKKRYSFPWREWKGKAEIYKLTFLDDTDILGVIALIDIPIEKRVEIKLLAVSKENIGKGKKYEGIAGCLIAYAGRLAKKEYGSMACISLIPKTELIAHYIIKYSMVNAGWQLFLEGELLNNLILKYIP